MRAFTVLLVKPRGFCAGVERAIGIVEEALARFGAPVFVLHEIVHNAYVLAQLTAKGQSSLTSSTRSQTAHRSSCRPTVSPSPRGLKLNAALCLTSMPPAPSLPRCTGSLTDIPQRGDSTALARSARASKVIGSKVYEGDTAVGQIEDVLFSLDHVPSAGCNADFNSRWSSRAGKSVKPQPGCTAIPALPLRQSG